MMADFTDLNDVIVDGVVQASGKLKGGQQATEQGDAVLLGADHKIPSSMVPSQEHTPAQVVQNESGITIDGTQLQNATVSRPGLMTAAEVLALDALNTAVGDLQDADGKDPFIITGDGSTKSFSITHNLGHMPVWSMYTSAGDAYITDITVTETTAVVSFFEAPSSGTQYRLVLR